MVDMEDYEIGSLGGSAYIGESYSGPEVVEYARRRIKYLFWKELNGEERVQALVTIGVTKPPLVTTFPQTIEGLFLSRLTLEQMQFLYTIIREKQEKQHER